MKKKNGQVVFGVVFAGQLTGAGLAGVGSESSAGWRRCRTTSAT